VQEVIYGAVSRQPIVHRQRRCTVPLQQDLAGSTVEKLAYLKNFGEGWGHLPSGVSAVFVDNHDTQRDVGGVLTYRDGGIYALANAFMLAWPYGSPTVMSSYTFTNRDAGPPSDANNKTLNTTCYSGWQCEHRWRVIANMVGFHNATQGAGMTNWYDNGNNHIAFGRNGKGYLPSTTRLRGQRPVVLRHCPLAGTDVIHGDFSNGSQRPDHRHQRLVPGEHRRPRRRRHPSAPSSLAGGGALSSLPRYEAPQHLTRSPAAAVRNDSSRSASAP
jgi:alpha-amylase